MIIAGNSDLDIEYVNVHLNGNQELNLRDLSYTAKYCRHRGQRSELNLSDRPEPTLQDMPYVASSRHSWQGAVFDPAKRHELNDRSLIYLLETFNRQKRQIGQGRLYPLLGLYSDGAIFPSRLQCDQRRVGVLGTSELHTLAMLMLSQDCR